MAGRFQRKSSVTVQYEDPDTAPKVFGLNPWLQRQMIDTKNLALDTKELMMEVRDLLREIRDELKQAPGT